MGGGVGASGTTAMVTEEAEEGVDLDVEPTEPLLATFMATDEWP